MGGDEVVEFRISRVDGAGGAVAFIHIVPRRPNIGIHVLPVSRGPHAAMNGNLVIMEFPPPDLPVVYLEAMSEEIHLEKSDEITRYQHIYDHVQAEALFVAESRRLVRDRLASL